MRIYRIMILILAVAGVLCSSHHALSFEFIPDKGIFFETFDECPASCTVINESMSYGYTVENGRVKIKTSSYIYDRDYYYPKNDWVFYRNNANPFFLLNMWINPDILSLLERRLYAVDPDYSSIAYRDNVSFESKSAWGFFVPFQHFRFNISQLPEGITGITFHWYGSTNGEKVRIYVWDERGFFGIGVWKLLEEIRGNTTCISVNLAIPKDCIDEKGTINLMLVPSPAESNTTFIKTDYVSLEVKKLATMRAYITTEIFEIDDNSRWECIEWDGEVSNKTRITLQVLDENGTVIDDDILEGNFAGFESKRVILVDLPVKKIRLRFKLETNDVLDTPYLDDFLLLWQLNGTRWVDDLSTDYRIEKKSENEIISKPIFLPAGYWWSDFSASVNLNGGKIVFSILDDKGSPLIQNISVSSGSDVKYKISTIHGRCIKLKAILEGHNGSTPKINRWNVTYSEENDKPVFRCPENIFLSEEERVRGKINVTVSAMDSFSGICNSSGRYMLYYIENLTGIVRHTDWLKANVDAKNGTTTWVNVTAENIPIFYDDSLKELLGLSGEEEIRLSGIKFRIEDMAGNENESKIIDIQIDTTPPRSWITTKVEDIGFKHSEPVEITADATDDLSNIKRVTLYYRLSKDNDSFSEPIKYGTLTTYPWKWIFSPDESGYFKLFTIAEDNAGNRESMKEGELLLLIDMNKPGKPQFGAGVHWLNNSRIDFVSFSDDFSIHSIEYKIGEDYFKWRKIAEDVNSSIYSEMWYIDEDDWNRMEDGKTYPVYFRVEDIVGNVYETQDYADALIIGKDTIPPKPFISPIRVWQWKLPVEISCYIPKNGSDITKVKIMYRYSPDNETWSEWKELDSTVFSGWSNFSFDPEEGDGYYEIKIEAWDAAGNHGISNIVMFGITRFPTIETAAMLSLFTILILISALFIRRWD